MDELISRVCHVGSMWRALAFTGDGHGFESRPDEDIYSVFNDIMSLLDQSVYHNVQNAHIKIWFWKILCDHFLFPCFITCNMKLLLKL